MSNNNKTTKSSPAATSTESATADTTEVVQGAPSTALVSGASHEGTLQPGVEDTRTPAEKMVSANKRLVVLAETAPELAAKLLKLAKVTNPHVKGIEGDQTAGIPSMMIRQKMTREDNYADSVKVGGFYTKQGDDWGNEMIVIPLRGTRKKVKFVKGEDRPECTSEDGITGNKHGDCATCPYGKYETGVKTQCSSGWNWTFVSEDFTKFFQVDFLKTSSSTGKRIGSLSAGLEAVYGRKLKLTSDKQTNEHGEFYVYKVAPTGIEVEGAEFQAADALTDFAMARAEAFRARFGGSATGGTLGAGTAGAGGEGDVGTRPSDNVDLAGAM